MLRYRIRGEVLLGEACGADIEAGLPLHGRGCGEDGSRILGPPRECRLLGCVDCGGGGIVGDILLIRIYVVVVSVFAPSEFDLDICLFPRYLIRTT